MKGQELGSHRRLDETESTQRWSSPTIWPSAGAHLVQEVKNLRRSQSKSRSLGGLWASQTESFPLSQKPRKGEHHHPHHASSAAECWDRATEGFSSSLITEMLQSGFTKRVELGTRRSSLPNPKEAWTEKNLEATAPIETQGKGRTVALPNQGNNQAEKSQNPQGQGYQDLWKDLVLNYGIPSPRRGLQMVSLYPKLTDNLEGHVLEGRKIHLRSRPQAQEMLSSCSLEESQEEEVQAPKREKAKDKRAKEREAQFQFSREKAFLQKKLRELGPVPGGGASLLDKKKAQALELSTKDNCLKSEPRVPRGNVQTLAQDDSAKETRRKQSKMEKRKLRTRWWDPTLWGDPVTLTKREQSPHKTCSRFHSDPWKPSFPIGRLSYKNGLFVPQED